MASHDPDPNVPPLSGRPRSDETPQKPLASDINDVVRTVLMPVASLKLTVVLFSLSIFLVLVGTLAQTRMDIWDVVHQYFRTWIATVDVNVFFPPAWSPEFAETDMGSFPFPGGKLIGSVMLVNLLAAHGLKFKIQTKGSRLGLGLALIGVGALVTYGVIIGGLNTDGVEDTAIFEWSTIWELTKASLVVTLLAGAWALMQLAPERRTERYGLTALLAGLTVLTAWLYVQGDDATIGTSSMRILWQLMQGGVAGLILLAGCALVFRKRAGIVLLHSGIILLMFNELMVGKSAEEGQMQITEGETVNYVNDIREVELAFVDRSDGSEDRVVAVPQEMLESTAGIISDERLPVDIRVKKYLQNSALRRVESGDKNPATTGVGLMWIADSASAGTGTDMDSAVDNSAAYIELIPKDESDEAQEQKAQTHLLSLVIARQDVPETITAAGKKWDVYLRFKRTYKPYSMHLVDVRFDKYIGTNTPQNYSSELQLYDEATKSHRMVKIWMNNPLRFAGETFYQSNYFEDPETGKQMTGLQVVKNAGWMIPYVSCMIVGVGMLAQFGTVLLRYLKRRAARGSFATQGSMPKVAKTDVAPAANPLALWLPVLAVCGLGLLVAYKAMKPEVPPGEMDFAAFGELPLVYQGRVKPFDTLARNSLRILSGKETYMASMSPEELEANWKKISASVMKKWPEVTEEDLEAFEPSSTQLVALLETTAKVDRAGIRAFVEEITLDMSEKEIHDNWDDEIISKVQSQWDKVSLRQIETYDREHLISAIEDATAPARERIQASVDKLTTSKQPAIRWFLDVIGSKPEVADHKVFRIENFEVQEILGLDRRSGFRYALKEFQPKIAEFEAQAQEARALDKNDLSTYQRKLLALDQRFRLFTLIAAAFKPEPVPPQPTQEEFEKDPEIARQKIMQMRQALVIAPQRLKTMQPPLAIPAEADEEDWEPYAAAWADAYMKTRILMQEPNEFTIAFTNILAAYEENDVDGFNDAVRGYRQLLEDVEYKSLDLEKVEFESFFNRFEPFFLCSVLYLVAFVVTILSWLVWQRPLGRTAFCMIVALFLLHTVALAARIYISGRPPVTNLYSSAVFIGWAGVLAGIVIEWLYRIGVGNVLAATVGYMTLLIAHYLSLDGDTFVVLQAVLDTQFWLATHVVCITLGYAATFVAGTLGVIYILAGLFTSALSTESQRHQQPIGKMLVAMIYGTLCFAIFFSFIGTVLGGLWADDSWGRFWGWDPKENGALIIVIWNALVLHARWDKLVRDRGLAMLAVAGNICTCWSWFGVNELGVGLHSYGFTEGVLLSLSIAIGVHLAIIAAGSLPLSIWTSFRRNNADFDEQGHPLETASV